MSRAIAGHGALIAIELTPVATPGVFTTVAELNGDIVAPGLNRPVTVVTTHQDNIDYNVLGVLSREPLTFGVNWIFDDPTHDFATGLGALIGANTFFGLQLRGPGGLANTDEWIMSGQLSVVGPITNPVREGARTAEVTFVPSGPMKIDGVMFGEPTV